jgi:hypothetical protein
MTDRCVEVAALDRRLIEEAMFDPDIVEAFGRSKGFLRNRLRLRLG